MASNYPLPSKALLVQQYVGKTLKEIPLPAAVIDIAAVKRNCQRMSDAVKELGFDFMLLVNAHKTTEIARLQIGDDPEEVRVLVTTLSEAENLLPLLLDYQKDGKQVNLLYGVPLPPSQIEQIANISRILGRRGGSVRLLVEHTSQIPLVQQIARLSGYPIYVYINVTVGGEYSGEVSGVRPGSQEFQDLFSQIERIILLEGPISLAFPGFYCHLDHGLDIFEPSHDFDAPRSIRPFSTQLSGLLTASPVQNIRFSINATAAISHLSDILSNESEDELMRERVEALRGTLEAVSVSQADNFIEVRDGIYPITDLNTLAKKAVLGLDRAPGQDLDDAALTILTEVCCVYEGRREGDVLPEEQERALITLGSCTLGQEPSRHYNGYGLVSHWGMHHEMRGLLDSFSGFQVARVDLHCGVLVWDGPVDLIQPLHLG
ncbi:hypothetical protein V8E51_010094 [Hyaloscypha variabilis]